MISITPFRKTCAHLAPGARAAYTATVTAFLTASALAQPRYVHLGFLNNEGAGPSIAYAVSPDGKLIVGESLAPQGFEAFAWTPQLGMRGLGDLAGGAYSSAAYAAANNGRAIVGASEDCCSGEEGTPFGFTLARHMFPLPGLHGPTSYGQAEDITPDARIAVGASQQPNAGIDAAMWSRATGLVNLGDLPGGVELARASAVSADGNVIVGTGSSDNGGFNVGFRWTQQTGMIALPGVGRTAALDISGDGDVIVGQQNGHAARWTQATGWVDLGTFGIGRGLYWASGTNRDGSIIVGIANYSGLEGTGEAFIWDAQNGIRSLSGYLAGRGVSTGDLPPYWAMDISADGNVIVGYGFNGRGEQEAFAAILQ